MRFRELVGTVPVSTLERFETFRKFGTYKRSCVSHLTKSSSECNEKLLKKGLRSVSIASWLKIFSSTVRNVSAAFEAREHCSEMPKSGTSRTVNTWRIRGVIEKRITHNDGANTNRIASDLNVSRRSIQIVVKNELKLKYAEANYSQFDPNRIDW